MGEIVELESTGPKVLVDLLVSPHKKVKFYRRKRVHINLFYFPLLFVCL
jgi:hypothetical protein